jgi:hypothetical protein
MTSFNLSQLVTPTAAANNSLNRSANSVAFIENLNLSALCTRPVNSSVRFLIV